MRWKSADRNIGKLVKIRPKVANSRIEDGDWFVETVDTSKRIMEIRHIATGHVAKLMGDCVDRWESDPNSERRGYLMLTRQLAFHGANISYEPLTRYR